MSRARILKDQTPDQAFQQANGEKSQSGNSGNGIRFVHAADLHLDAAFMGLSRDVPHEIAACLRDATFAALENLFVLCEKIQPDFLLLAGDVYNQEDLSLRAQLAIRDGCERLAKAGVAVCIVHGNHDPLSSRLKNVRWPDNVTVFGEQVSSQSIFREGNTLATIHGASHAVARETRNLAAMYARTTEPGLHIGLLHTTLGEADGKNSYAPCSLSDLAASGMDYWALGHIHDRRVVSERPFAQYPGSLQGLHIAEQGAHGCLVVDAVPDGKGYAFTTHFQPLDTLEWRELAVTVAEDETLDSLEARIRNALDVELADVLSARERAGFFDAPCRAVLFRIRLEGRTALDGELREPLVLADFLEQLRSGWSEPLVWIKDFKLRTQALADRSRLSARDDLLGEIVRLAEEYRNDPDALMALRKSALGPLYDHSRARKILDKPEREELEELLKSAEALCIDLLEGEGC